MSGPVEEKWMSEYWRLVKRMYAVRKLCPRLGLLGVSTLHPRHSLPADQMRLMEELQGLRKKPGRPSWALLIGQWLWCALFASRETLRLAILRIQCRGILKRIQRIPAGVIMKTWRFSDEPLNGTPDFYYGTLPRQLLARGIECLLLCGDARGGFHPMFAKATLGEADVRSVPEASLIPLWAPLWTVFRQAGVALVLRRLAARVRDPRLAAVCRMACVNSVQPATMRHNLYFYVARSAVRIWKPRAFLSLYEGQPWETAARHGVKAADPACVTVGYQHTVVMPHSMQLLRPRQDSWECAIPDLVLCLGEATQRMMSPGHGIQKNNRLIVFGSYRRPQIDDAPAKPHPERCTVLVLPEGIMSEAQLLFRQALEVACRMRDHRFIFRCHPVLPFDAIQPSLPPERLRLPNVEISRLPSILADFDRSSVVLYRGSSSVFYAVLRGLKPVYLHRRGLVDIDPLFEMTPWKARVSNTDELEALLREYAADGSRDLSEGWDSAFRYVNDYTVPVDEGAVDRLVGAIG